MMGQKVLLKETTNIGKEIFHFQVTKSSNEEKPFKLSSVSQYGKQDDQTVGGYVPMDIDQVKRVIAQLQTIVDEYESK